MQGTSFVIIGVMPAGFSGHPGSRRYQSRFAAMDPPG